MAAAAMGMVAKVAAAKVAAAMAAAAMGAAATEEGAMAAGAMAEAAMAEAAMAEAAMAAAREVGAKAAGLVAAARAAGEAAVATDPAVWDSAAAVAMARAKAVALEEDSGAAREVVARDWAPPVKAAEVVRAPETAAAPRAVAVGLVTGRSAQGVWKRDVERMEMQVSKGGSSMGDSRCGTSFSAHPLRMRAREKAAKRSRRHRVICDAINGGRSLACRREGGSPFTAQHSPSEVVVTAAAATAQVAQVTAAEAEAALVMVAAGPGRP